MNRQEAKTKVKALRLDPEISNRFNCDLRQTTDRLIALIDEINEFNSQRFNQRANEAQTEENEESPEEAVSRLAREIIEADESWGMTTETETTENLQALYEEIDEGISAAEDEDLEDYHYPTTEKYRGEYDALIDSYFPEDEEAQEEAAHYTPSFPQPYIKPSVWYGITEGMDGGDRGSHFIHPSAQRQTP